MSASTHSGLKLKDLRLSQDFISCPVEKKVVHVPIGRPNKQMFIRIKKDESFESKVAILEMQETNELYLVTPDLVSQLSEMVRPAVLVTYITRKGDIGIWPLKISEEGSPGSTWHTSAALAAQRAREKWIRLQANKNIGAYEVFEAMGNIPEPEWPNLTFDEILEIAFRDRVISSLDHPVIKDLEGR